MRRIIPLLIAVLTIVCLVSSMLASLPSTFVNANPIWMEDPENPRLPLIEILDNGTVSPPTPSIRQEGDVYYLTQDISGHRLAIARSNVTLDGQGFTLLGNRSKDGIGLCLATNITVRNLVVKSFPWGIYDNKDCGAATITNSTIVDCAIGIIFWTEPNNTVTNCVLERNDEAITIRGSSWNVLEHNLLKYNINAIVLETATWDITSTHNTIGNNTFLHNQHGVSLDGAFENQLSENNFTDNVCGVLTYFTSRSNTFWLNNFVTNYKAVDFQNPTYIYHGGRNDSWPNSWDNGTMGNYWSDYLEQDLNADGLADTEFVLGENNIDHYPLMEQFYRINTAETPTETPVQSEPPVTPEQSKQPTTPEQIEQLGLPVNLSELIIIVVVLIVISISFLVYFKKVQTEKRKRESQLG